MLPSPTMGLAYDGAGGFANSFVSIVDMQGKNLADSHFTGIFDTNYFEDGKNSAISRAFAATQFRGTKITFPSLGPIYQFNAGVPDSSHNIIEVDLRGLVTSGGKSFFLAYPQTLKCNLDGTGCVDFGNQKPARTSVDPIWFTLSANPSPPTQQGYLAAYATGWTGSSVGRITSASVTDGDGTFFASPTSLFSLGQKSYQLAPTPTTTQTATFDVFGVSATPVLPPFPDYTDPFNFDLNFTIAPPSTAVRFATGYTIEPIHLVRPFFDSTHLIGDAHPGGSLGLSWKLPTSFVPRVTYAYGNACSTAGGQNVNPTKPVLPLDTSATLKFPKQVLGQPINGANAFVETLGSFGQHSLYQYQFGAGCTF